MAKPLKQALKVFAVTFLVLTGVGIAMGAFAGGFTLSAIGSTILFTGGMTIAGYATLAGVSILVAGLLQKGVEATSANFGTKVSTRAATAPRQLVYGKTRVGGVITHIQTTGSDNYLLTFVSVIAGHELESLEEVQVNDTILTTTTSGGFQYATNSDFTNSENDNKFSTNNSLLRFVFVDGSQTTANSTVTANSSLTSTDKFTGCAYVFIQCVFDAEKFGGGFPKISFTVKGKKVFDPRDSSTAWSDNPALIARDFITDTVYGLKATSEEIDDTTNLGGFAAAANTCESSLSTATATVNGAISNATVVVIDTAANQGLIGPEDIVTGTGISGTVKVVRRRGNRITLSSAQSIADGVTLTFSEPTYKANGFTNFAASGQGVLEGILSSMGGKVSYINGKFVIFAGATVTPEMTITDDQLLAPAQVATNPSGHETFNQVKSVFVDPNSKYQAEETPTYTDSTLLAADTPTGESTANYRKTLELQFPFTTSNTLAQRLQKQALLHHRQKTTIQLTTNIAFMQLQVFDWVYVTNERLGYTNKVFEVLGQSLEVMGEKDNPVLATRLTLKEIDGSVYSFLSSAYENPQDEGDEDDTGDFSLTAPTNLALAQQSIAEGAGYKMDIKATWTNNTADKVIGTEMTYKLSTDSDYTSDIFIGKGASAGLIPNVAIGKTYNVKLAHLDINGVKSAYTSAVNITITDPTSISAPSAFTASGNRVGIVLQWTNPNVSNLRAVKIYRKTSNSTPTNDTNLVHTMMGEPNAKSVMFQGAMDGLTAGTTYYFWLRAITHTGLHSSFTSSVNASYSVYDKGDIGLNLVTNDAQVKSDLSNFSVESDLFEVTSNELRGKTAIKNSQVTLAKDGSGNLSLNNAGSGNVSFDKNDVGLNNLTNDTQVKSDLTNLSLLADDFEVNSGSLRAKNALKNNQISIGSDGSLTGAGGGQATAVGLGAVKTDLTNAPTGIKNDQVTLAKDSSGNLSLNNAGSGNVSFDKDDVGLDQLTNDAQVKSDLSNLTLTSTDLEVSGGSLRAKNALKNSQISISAAGVLSNAGGGTVSATGLGAVKTDLTNAPTGIKNDQVTLAKDSSGNISLNNAGSGNISLDKDDVGLDQLTNDAQVKSDLSNLALESDDLEVNSGSLRAKNALKNSQISISAAGALSGAGGGTVSATGIGAIKTDATNAPNSLKNSQVTLAKDSSGNISLSNAGSGNISLDKDDIGLDQLTNDAQVKSDLSNLSLESADLEVNSGSLRAKNALKNSQISISAAGVLSNAGGGTVSATGLGAVKTDLTNAPASIKNENTTASDVGLDQVTNHAQVKADLTNLSLTSTDLEVSGGSLQAKNALKNSQISISAAGALSGAGGGTVSATGIGAIKTDATNAPNSLKNNQITLGLSGTSLSLNNAGSGTQTLGKANVGLSDLASLDSTRSGKLDGVATGSTNNGSTIDTNGNITGNMSVGATMTIGTNSDDKIVVGNITIDGGNGRILITD